MALAALVFMRFGGFGTGENVNPEEFLAYAEPVENITVPESAKIIALGEATHGNAVISAVEAGSVQAAGKKEWC